ncbi:hypothetical protein H5410_051815, partial [Solanum commersonii]
MQKDADLILIHGRSIEIYTYQKPTKYIIWYNNRAKGNKTMFLNRASKKTSTSSYASPMVVTPAGQQVIPIAEMSSPTSVTYIIHKYKTCHDYTCIFQIDLIDGPDSATTSTSEKLLPVNHVQEMLSNKLFSIQLRKSSWGSSNNTHTTLSILSYVEKEQTLPPSTTERNSKRIKPLEISEVEIQATTTTPGSSSAMPKFEPPTLTKKCVK